MQAQNALKKLKKFTGNEPTYLNNFVYFSYKDQVIELLINSENRVSCVTVMAKGDQSDAQRDYHAGVPVRNVSQAISLVSN